MTREEESLFTMKEIQKVYYDIFRPWMEGDVSFIKTTQQLKKLKLWPLIGLTHGESACLLHQIPRREASAVVSVPSSK